jgi:20S proteasome subunit alpha 7
LKSFCFQYDLSASQFSPDGRVFQIEYAAKASEISGTAIGLRGRDGCVLAVEKVITSKLHEPDSGRRVFTIENSIGLVNNSLLRLTNDDNPKFILGDLRFNHRRPRSC